MSHSDFNWPMAAPGAFQKPTQSRASFFVTMESPSVAHNMAGGLDVVSTIRIPMATRPARSLVTSSGDTIAHVKATPTAKHTPTTAPSANPLLHQTQPLILHASRISTKPPPPPVPKAESSTPPNSPISIAATPEPTPLSSSIPSTSPSPSPSTKTLLLLTLPPALILTTFLLLLAIFLYRRRRHRKNRPSASPSALEAARPETLEQKMQRMREWRRKRIAQGTARNWIKFREAKEREREREKRGEKGGNGDGDEDGRFVVGDGEEDGVEEEALRRQARRPSGLAMNPPTPVRSADGV